MEQLRTAVRQWPEGGPNAVFEIMDLTDELASGLTEAQVQLLQGPECPFHDPEGNDGHAHWVLDQIMQGSFGLCPVCEQQVKLF